MKQFYQKILTLGLTALLFFTASNVMGQALIEEDFDYGSSTGDLTTVGSANWGAHSGSTGVKVDYLTTSLSLSGYASSGVGGSIAISGSGAEDINYPFTEQSSGTIYMSALIDVSAMSGSGNYFMHFNSSGFLTRVAAKEDGSGGLNFGIGTGSTITYGTTSFALNTTYLLVASYEVSTGISNLYILTTAETTEPATPEATSTGTTGSSASAVSFRQSGGIPTANIDGVRVATSWSDLIPVLCTPPTSQATFGAFTGTGDNVTTINFTRGDGDAGVLILAKEGSAVDAAPSSGTAYSANAAFGSGDEIGTGNFVVYNGTGTTEDLTALALGTTYHFAAFEYNTTGTCYLTPGATTDVTTTGDALPEIISAVTPATETSNDIIITFSEDVSFTTEGGFAIEIGTPLATIQSQTQTAPDEITLTIAEDISKNSEEIILSYNAFASGASIVDGGAQALQNTNETIVNNTTLNVVTNITEARALSSGEDVRITGGVIVTYLTGNTRNQFFIQDADAGLLVDDNSGTVTTAYNAGDEIINFQGALSSFGGVTQFVPAADPGTANSTGNAITPIVVTIADHNANPDTYESRVLRFNEVTFNEADGTSTFDAQASATSTLNDGANTLDFDADNGSFDFTNIDYATNVIPQGRLDVIAIGRDSKVSSRSATDIQDNYEPVFTQAPAASTPTVSAFDVTFRLDEPSTIYYIVNENASATLGDVLSSSDNISYTDTSIDGTISATGLNDNTQYYVHIVAADDESTPNEQASVTTLSATTEAIVFDATSDIVAAASPIGAATLSSVANADTDAVDVFNFTVTDDNATDTEPTTINTITIENNNSATWSSIIEGASITDGVNTATATSITDTDITFDVSGSPFFVTGGTNLTFTLSVWLQATQTDGTELSFIIPAAHAFEADAAGSVIKPTLDAAVTSATHTIDVEATTFATTTPERVMPNTDFSVGVIAQDANGNTDIAARTIEIFASSGNLGASGNLTSATGISGQAMTDGEYTWNDLQYDQVEEIILDVTDGSITESTTFISVTETQVETFDNYPETGSSYVDGTFTGQDGSTWTYVQARGDQTIDGVTPMLGRNRTPDAEMTSGTISGGIGTLSFDYSQAFSSNVELEVHINGDSITTVRSDNQEGVLLSSGDILVEVEGDFTMSFQNLNGGQVNIDNVAWTPYVDPCVEPTTQATALGATVIDNTTIDLDWTVGNGDATLVLAKLGTAVDADPEILNAYTADAAFGAGTELGTGNFVVYNGADATIQVTGLSQGTEYHFAAYAFNTANNCYYLVEPALANATTSSDNDADSDILAADAPIATGTVPATATSEENAVAVFNFKIADLGTADGEPTIVNSVKIVPAASNTASWSTVLAGATLTDNTFSATNAVVTDEAITFDLSTNAFTVNDGADSTLTLSVYLNATQTDGEVLAFEIPTTHEFVADGAGSLFVGSITGASSNNQTIDVIATKLVTTNVPTTVVLGEAFGFALRAEDENANIDTSERTISLSTDAGVLGGSISDVIMTDGRVTFDNLTYDTEGNFTINITDGSLATTTSSIEAVTEISGTLFFSEYIEGTSNNRAIEIYNATDAAVDLSNYTVKQSHNGVGFDMDDVPDAYSLQLSGTLAPGDVYVIYNNQATLQGILEEGDLGQSYGDTDGARMTSFTGDDALGLFEGSILIDLFGDPDNDPGSSWDVAGVTGATVDHTLVRKPSVVKGNITALGSFGTNADNSEWIVNPIDDDSNIGFHQVAGDDIPELTVVESITDFGSVENGQVSSSQSFTVAGSTLLSDVMLTVTSNYELSIDDTNFSSELTLSATNNTVAETTVFVRFAPNSGVDGVIDGLVSINTTGAVTEEITLTGSETGNPEVLFAENFENCDVTNYNTFSVTGDQEWSCTNFGQTGSAVRMNGFSSGAQENEDWLITNAVALSSAFSANFSFFSDVSFPVESVGLEVLISEDYAGSGDPTTANWTALSVTLDENGDSDSWTSSGLVDLTAYAGKSVYFAFKYNSTTDGAAQWTIDNLLVQLTNTAISSSLVVNVEGDSFDFGSIEAGTQSAAQSFTVSGVNLTENVSIAVTAGYQVSLNETADFESSINIETVDEGIEETTVYVRFTPDVSVTGAISGEITLASGDLSEVVAVTGTATEPTTTANKAKLEGVKAYPNPTANYVNVEIADNTKEFTYQVIALDGSVLVNGKARVSERINISTVETGMYILEVTQGEKAFVTRIVKH